MHTNIAKWSLLNLEIQCLSCHHQSLGGDASASCNGPVWKELTAVRPPTTIASGRVRRTAGLSRSSRTSPANGAVHVYNVGSRNVESGGEVLQRSSGGHSSVSFCGRSNYLGCFMDLL